MQVYPAMKAAMGDWDYYLVRMTMREVAKEVELASQLWTDETLSDAIQRTVSQSRVKHELVKFLSRRDDRFFSSLVVAAIGGNPTWRPVESPFADPVFGELRFQTDPRYYALDGQHRLLAIQELLEDPAGAPPGFANEQISVIVVTREQPSGSAEDRLWIQRYRRLFSSLNRYAKPTDPDTNIIMDEDDIFAIATRALIADHWFFRVPPPEKQSFRVLTKGKRMDSGAPHFTNLQTLYAMNRTLLMSTERRRRFGRPRDLKVFLQFRPDEAEIDLYCEEVSQIWDGLIEALPVLRSEPELMRAHEPPEVEPEKYSDHLAFWPVGQEVFARVARSLLDRAGLDPVGGAEATVEALLPLQGLPWDLHAPPWRHYFLVDDPKTGKPRMRSEDRTKAVNGAEELFRWMCGLDPLNEAEEEELRDRWSSLLYPQAANDEIKRMWERVTVCRSALVGSTG